jgi:hypothetical protein
MATSDSSPDGSDSLTRRQRDVLAKIGEDLRASDFFLAERLTGDDPADFAGAPPVWAVQTTRLGLILIAVALFIPFEWWSWLALLTMPVFSYRVLGARTADDGLPGTERDNP